MRYLLYAMGLAAMAVSADEIVWQDIAHVGSNASSTKAIAVSLVTKLPVPSDKVDRVAVEPVILQVAIGTLVCISQFDVATYSPNGERLAGVPLSLAILQDQLAGLKMEAAKPKDLCFRPVRAGEITLRFTSRAPAADGTLRGAQVFVRAP